MLVALAAFLVVIATLWLLETRRGSAEPSAASSSAFRRGRCVPALAEQRLVSGERTTPRATCGTDGQYIACNTGRLPYGPRV